MTDQPKGMLVVLAIVVTLIFGTPVFLYESARWWSWWLNG